MKKFWAILWLFDNCPGQNCFLHCLPPAIILYHLQRTFQAICSNDPSSSNRCYLLNNITRRAAYALIVYWNFKPSIWIPSVIMCAFATSWKQPIQHPAISEDHLCGFDEVFRFVASWLVFSLNSSAAFSQRIQQSWRLKILSLNRKNKGPGGETSEKDSTEGFDSSIGHIKTFVRVWIVDSASLLFRKPQGITWGHLCTKETGSNL